MLPLHAVLSKRSLQCAFEGRQLCAKALRLTLADACRSCRRACGAPGGPGGVGCRSARAGIHSARTAGAPLATRWAAFEPVRTCLRPLCSDVKQALGEDRQEQQPHCNPWQQAQVCGVCDAGAAPGCLAGRAGACARAATGQALCSRKQARCMQRRKRIRTQWQRCGPASYGRHWHSHVRRACLQWPNSKVRQRGGPCECAARRPGHCTCCAPCPGSRSLRQPGLAGDAA